MKIKITTDRLPNKFPKGEEHEVAELTGILATLVMQGEAEIVGIKKEVKKVKKVVKKVKKTKKK